MSQRIGITEEGKLVIYTDNAKIDGDDITSNIAGDFNITAENVQRLRGKSYSKYQQLNFFTSENQIFINELKDNDIAIEISCLQKKYNEKEKENSVLNKEVFDLLKENEELNKKLKESYNSKWYHFKKIKIY